MKHRAQLAVALERSYFEEFCPSGNVRSDPRCDSCYGDTYVPQTRTAVKFESVTGAGALY